ncbi:MAG: hypothetical protein UDS56_06550 [Faecalibacterium prausnitzii]|nr:hypothetical protein [Faecalibacterium prausnitzii]
MENFNELLQKYADFIVRVGVNPQPGQRSSTARWKVPRWHGCACAAPTRPVRGTCR